MKKISALFMMIVFVFSLAACSNTSSEKENSAPSSVSQGEKQTSENNTSLSSDSSEKNSTSSSVSKEEGQTSENNASLPSDSSELTNTTDGKTLVVYYSASGNTERVAKDIAQAAGADLFEIEPAQPYTDADLNWTDSNSRVSREHDDKTLRNVPLKTTEVSNWDSYDTVLVGYPKMEYLNKSVYSA